MTDMGGTFGNDDAVETQAIETQAIETQALRLYEPLRFSALLKSVKIGGMDIYHLCYPSPPLFYTFYHRLLCYSRCQNITHRHPRMF